MTERRSKKQDDKVEEMDGAGTGVGGATQLTPGVRSPLVPKLVKQHS